MVIKTAEMAYTSKQLKSTKWLLLLCAACAAAVDTAIIALLFAGGLKEAKYFVCPFALLILDVIYFIVSLFFTNFRFKYSLIVWLSYIICYTLGIALGSALLFGDSGTVLSSTASGIWACVHIFGIICAVIVALSASRLIKKFWIALSVAAVFFVGCAGYVGFMCANGFFGQGTKGRTLVYTVADDGNYRVSGVLSGSSRKVEIPEEFNGRKVTAIDCNVFAASGVNEYVLNSRLELSGTYGLARNFNFGGRSVKVNKADVNYFRDKLRSFVLGANDEILENNAATLANAVLPAELGDGENFVALNYNAEAVKACRGKTVPVYVGSLSNYNFAEVTSNYEYIVRRENGSVENYNWAYKYNNRFILSDIIGENGSVFDGISGNTVAQVKFESVYKVYVENGNDRKYFEKEEQPDFCSDRIDGGATGFKYLTKPKANAYLKTFEERKGFTYEWKRVDLNPNEVFTDLAAQFDNASSGNTVRISPEWKLNAPQLNVSSSVPSGVLTYGTDLTLTANASVEAEGVRLIYAWTDEDGIVGTQSQLNLIAPRVEKSGGYMVTVAVDGGEVTSLTAQSYQRLDVQIKPKEVSFNWKLTDGNGAEIVGDLVYDGKEKFVVAEFDESQYVGSDKINYTVYANVGTDDNVIDAGDYIFLVSQSGYCLNDYDIKNTSYQFSVSKREVEVTWSGADDLVYNGLAQAPSASALGVDGSQLIAQVSGGQRNAGADYKAYARTDNGNYQLKGAEKVFSIAKRPLTVSVGDARCEYGSQPQTSGIAISYSGFVFGESSSVLGGAAHFEFTPVAGDANYKAGSYENGVKLSGYTSDNYEISYEYGRLTVSKRAVQLRWIAYTNLIYDAAPKNVRAVIDNKFADDSVEVTVTGGNEVAAGNNYTAQATGLSGDDAENYALPADINARMREYAIMRASVNIVIKDKSTVYGDALAPLNALVEGNIYNDEIAYKLVKSEGTGAGEYAISGVITKDNANYEVTFKEGIYTIRKREIMVSWRDLNCEYDGAEQQCVSCTYNGILPADAGYAKVEGDTATNAGDYTARFVLDGAVAGNYTVVNAQYNYRLRKARVEVAFYINGEVISVEEGVVTVTLGDELTWRFITEELEASIYFDETALPAGVKQYTFEEAGQTQLSFYARSDNYEVFLKNITFFVGETPEV